MLSTISDRFRWLTRTPRRWVPAALLLVGLLYLGWCEGSALWLRTERGRAERAIAGYDFAEGRRRLDRCIRFRPRDPELLLLAARTARRDGDLATAGQHLDTYRAVVRELTPQLVLERQLIEAQEGRIHEVVNDLIEAIEIHHPQTEQILESLVMGSAHSYQFAETLFWANELLERWPKNGIGRLLKAQTTDAQGNREKAIATLRELIADYPRYSAARLTLAEVLFKSQRHREAIEQYAALHQQRPGELAPLLGLASSYDRLGDPAAGPLMKELLERFPDSSEALLECGRHAMAQRDPAAAEPLFRRAAELSPSDHEIHREFAICLEQLGKREESRQHLERFKQIEGDLILLEKMLAEIAKAPQDLAPRRKAGEICLRNGQVAEGLRWLNGILDRIPDDEETHRILADYWTARGDLDRAAPHRPTAGPLSPRAPR